jgi:ankyrin repeat protein
MEYFMNFKSVSLALVALAASQSGLAMEKEPQNIVEAAKNKNIEAVQRFLDQGVSPDSTDPADEYGCRPLGWAAANGDIDIVRLLLERGASIDCANKFGETPLAIAVGHGKLDVACLLIEKDADINYKDRNENTPLMHCAFYNKTEAVCLLLEKGAKIDLQNNWGYTALREAIWRGNQQVIQLLIEKGADIVEEKLNLMKKPKNILEAIEDDNLPAVKNFIKNGVDINQRVGWQEEPLLHKAAARGNLAIVKELIANGANVDGARHDGETALHEASAVTSTTHGMPNGWHSTINTYPEVIRELIESGIPVNCVMKGKLTPLHRACENGHLNRVKELIRNGAGVNQPDEDGQTPLYYTFFFDSAVIARELLNHGATINWKDNKGQTPLDVAKKTKNAQKVIALLSDELKKQEEFKSRYTLGPTNPLVKQYPLRFGAGKNSGQARALMACAGSLFGNDLSLVANSLLFCRAQKHYGPDENKKLPLLKSLPGPMSYEKKYYSDKKLKPNTIRLLPNPILRLEFDERKYFPIQFLISDFIAVWSDLGETVDFEEDNQ